MVYRITIYTYDDYQRLIDVRKDDVINLNTDQGYNSNINNVYLQNTLTYDSSNRVSLLCTRNADAAWIAEKYSYDWIGNVTEKATAFDLMTNQIDYLNQLPFATLKYGYNNAGVRTSLTLPNNQVITSKFNNSGQMTNINSNYGNAKYGYDADGRLTGYLRGKTENSIDAWKVQTFFSRDSVGKMLSLTNAAIPTIAAPDINIEPVITGNVIKSKFSDFTYDANGRMTGYKAKVDGLTTGTERDISFEYDSRGQLTGEKHHIPGEATNTFWSQMVYHYDTTGTGVNLTGIDRQLPMQTMQDAPELFTFDTDNRIINDGYTFNSNTGNPTIYDNMDMVYDADNRLIEASKTIEDPDPYATPGSLINILLMRCGYFADGKRAWKESNSTRTYFLYDGDQLLCEMRVDDTYNYYPTAINLWGADGLAGRAVKTGTGTSVANYTTTWYAYDQQGKVAQRFADDGTLTSVYACDAFGNTLAGVEDIYNYNAKSGYYYDSEIGMYYCWHRYYDPVNGRWLTEDPIGYEGGLNLYGYCGNGPAGSVDASGLAWLVRKKNSDEEWCYMPGNSKADKIGWSTIGLIPIVGIISLTPTIAEPMCKKDMLKKWDIIDLDDEKTLRKYYSKTSITELADEITQRKYLSNASDWGTLIGFINKSIETSRLSVGNVISNIIGHASSFGTAISFANLITTILDTSPDVEQAIFLSYFSFGRDENIAVHKAYFAQKKMKDYLKKDIVQITKKTEKSSKGNTYSYDIIEWTDKKTMDIFYRELSKTK